MNNKLLTATEEKIRNLVPRLRELSFGCEVESCGMIKYIINETWDDNYSSINGDEITFTQCSGYISAKIEDFKIIGHPITLAHARDALCNSGNGSRENKLYLINNWVDDTLEQQHEDVIGWFYDLLFDTQ